MSKSRAATAPDERLGTTVGGYKLIAVIRTEATGALFRAERPDGARTAAVRIVNEDLAANFEVRRRVLTDFERLQGVRHPYLADVLGSGDDDGVLYAATDDVYGGDVAGLVGQHNRLGFAEAAQLVSAAADGLQAAHEKGVMHGSLAADVLFLYAVGDGVYVTGFGLPLNVRPMSSRSTDPAFWYAAPEALRGDPIGPAADVYGLGCVLFHAVTGEVPHVADSFEAVVELRSSAPAPSAAELVPALTPRCDEVLSRALAPDPADRYGSIAELGQATRDAAKAGIASGWDRELAAAAASAEAPVLAPPRGDGARAHEEPIPFEESIRRHAEEPEPETTAAAAVPPAPPPLPPEPEIEPPEPEPEAETPPEPEIEPPEPEPEAETPPEPEPEPEPEGAATEETAVVEEEEARDAEAAEAEAREEDEAAEDEREAERPEEAERVAAAEADGGDAGAVPWAPAGGRRKRRLGLVAAAGAVLLVGGGLVAALSLGGDDDVGDLRGGSLAIQRPAPPGAERQQPPRAERPSPQPRTPSRPATLTPWPEGRTAWTAVIYVSFQGRGPAAAKAREGVRKGFKAGVLRSGDYPRLPPGRWVAFVGTFDTQAAAERQAERARRAGLAGRPYTRLIRGGGG